MRCANCGSGRLEWTHPALDREGPRQFCAVCHSMSLTDRPPDGELLVEIRDSLREIQKTLTMLAERIP